MKRLLLSLGIASLLAATAHAEPQTIRVQATPSWSIAIPPTFKQVPHDDSWQAVGDDRAIYVSSLLVSEGNESDAATVEKVSAKWLSGATSLLQYHADGVEGRAGVIRDKGVLNLKGFMMAKGRVVVCVVSYKDAKQQSWAADTWRSLRLEPTPKDSK